MQGEDAPSRASSDGASPSGDRGPATAGDIIDLTAAQMQAASRLRAARRRAVPMGAVVAVGGRDLRLRSVEQPFPDERPVRDGVARLILLCALLVGMSGGYLYVTGLSPERSVIEVTPPESRQTVISAAPASAALAPGA
ncbi:MAG: hypothetical protein EA385_07345 [Salinarimonadaceae bacterium]|nr:MAG: hypothetical protein EA385_07345 [Salinarimonadaceae bacterium]